MSTQQLSETVTVRYWAAAQAAAGVAQESYPAGRVGQILDAARGRHPELERVLAVATILRDGRVVRAGDEVAAGDEVEVLPPFAGG